MSKQATLLGFYTKNHKAKPITAPKGKHRAARPTKLRIKKQPAPPSERYEPQFLPIEYSFQNGMANWSEKDAKAAAKVLEPYVGEEMMLYGGGGPGSSYVKLRAMVIEQWDDYSKPPINGVPQKNDTDWRVVLRTSYNSGDRSMFNKKGEFSPYLGSWKIAGIKKG